MRLRGSICLFIIAGLSLGLSTEILLPKGYALAENKETRGLNLLTKALKAYEAGAYTDALAAIEEAFKAGLDSELAARAILLRAEANEKSGKLARALSDYSSALWMHNLPASERKRATEGKERVMAAMGLNSSPQRQAAAKPSEPGRSASAPQSEQSGPRQGGGVFGFFNGLFGGSSGNRKPEPVATESQSAQTVASQPATAVLAKEPEAQSPSAPVVQPKKVRPAPGPHQVASIKQTPVQHAALAPKPVAPRQQTQSMAAEASAGGFHIDFGSLPAEAAAHTKAHQIKARLSDILVHRDLLVQLSGGAFHIVAGPYKTQSAANALCSAMKQRGVSCQVTQ